jgi:hypothetical protein
MESGWDPRVRRYFRKILNSIAYGVAWMFTGMIAGLYYGLAYTNGKPLIYTVLFYVFMCVTLWLLVRYLYKTWRKE